jgi:hypothetical protein
MNANFFEEYKLPTDQLWEYQHQLDIPAYKAANTKPPLPSVLQISSLKHDIILSQPLETSRICPDNTIALLHRLGHCFLHLPDLILGFRSQSQEAPPEDVP